MVPRMVPKIIFSISKLPKSVFENVKIVKFQFNVEWSEMLLGRWETVQNAFTGKMLKLSIFEHIKPKK